MPVLVAVTVYPSPTVSDPLSRSKFEEASFVQECLEEGYGNPLSLYYPLIIG